MYKCSKSIETESVFIKDINFFKNSPLEIQHTYSSEFPTS